MATQNEASIHLDGHYKTLDLEKKLKALAAGDQSEEAHAGERSEPSRLILTYIVVRRRF
jgi:hypothetical protein